MQRTPQVLSILALTGVAENERATDHVLCTVRRMMLIAGVFGMGLIVQQSSAIQQPPKALVWPVTDEYFGQRIVTPYRWIEDDKNPGLLGWMKAQNAYACTYLDRLPGHAALLQRSREVETRDIKVGKVLRSGERYLYTRFQAGDNLSKLYIQDGLFGAGRLLFDPARDLTDQKHVPIGALTMSDERRYASFLMMAGGGEYRNLRFIDLVKGQDLLDWIEYTRWRAGSWAPDGRSILYIRFQKLPSGAPAITRAQKTAIYRHRFGGPNSADTPVLGYGVDNPILIAPEELGFTLFVEGSPYEIASMNTGISLESKFNITGVADLNAASISWPKVALRADQVSEVAVHADDLYLFSLRNAPRLQAPKTSASRPDLAQAQVVWGASEAVVKQIGAAKDGLYLGMLEGGPHCIYRIDYAFSRKEELPFWMGKPLNCCDALLKSALIGTLFQRSQR